MKNPHIIIGEPSICLCGSYELLYQNPPNEGVPVSCRDILNALERLVQTGNQDAFLLDRVIQPIVRDCPCRSNKVDMPYGNS